MINNFLNISNNNSNNFYSQFISEDYPVNVYYIDFSQMFMGVAIHHWHNEMEIDIVKSGNACFKIGEESINITEGNAIIINEGRIHSICPENKDNCIIISILFSPTFIFGEKDSFISTKYRDSISNNMSFPFIKLMTNSISHKAGFECINQILNDNLQKNFGYELLSKSNLCKLWIWLLEAKDKNILEKSTNSAIDESRVKQGIIYIRQNFNQNISLESLADNIHLSKSECCRCFKRAANLTPFEYIMKYRIYVSAWLMQQNDKVSDSICDLAAFVGFNNASYFNKIFKSYLGITPTKYKNIIKSSHRDSLNPYGIPLSKN